MDKKGSSWWTWFWIILFLMIVTSVISNSFYRRSMYRQMMYADMYDNQLQAEEDRMRDLRREQMRDDIMEDLRRDEMMDDMRRDQRRDDMLEDLRRDQMMEDLYRDELRRAVYEDYYPSPQNQEQDLGYICNYNAYNCADFTTHAEAQMVYEICGGPSSDVHKLDRDMDGFVCETLP